MTSAGPHDDTPDDQAGTCENQDAAADPYTDPASDPVSDPASDSNTPRPTSKRFVASMLTLAAFALAFSGLLWMQAPSAYVELVPGPTFDLAAGLDGEVRDPTATSHGPVLMTTVRVEELSNLQWLSATLPWRQSDLVPAAEPGLGGDPGVPLAQMEASKQTAAIVAAQKVDGEAALDSYGSGARVLEVVEGSPAEDAGLAIGDVIVAIDGTAMATQEEVIDEIVSRPPGSVVELSLSSFDADDVGRSAAVTTDSEGRIGVLITTAFDDGDALVTSDTAGVGGSSGGLMLTLTFIDALSPGDLFASRSVAGTGTISLDGSVGPIQGIEHKVAASMRDGATVFFAPQGNSVQASDAAGDDITVVAVSSYLEALEWLCANGATDAVCDTI